MSLLELEIADQASREAAVAEPSRSAAIDEEIASELDAAGFPGHAQLIRRRAATTLLGAGRSADCFRVLYGLARSRLLNGASLDSGLHFQLLTLASRNVLGQADRARLALLLAIHNWPSAGSGLAEAAPALAQLRAADDPDTGILACTILEHALVDGIFEHQPPRSLAGDCPPETAGLAQEILALAGEVSTPDRLWQARIRCAVADAELDRARAAGQLPSPSSAYSQLVNDALAERYPPRAASLVLSRAARAHAVGGEGAHAVDRWRGSVTQACRARLYGDVRDLFRAIQYVAMETDPGQAPNVSVVAEGLPNRERLLAGSGEPALAAFEASHNGKVPDAFEDARRCLREARLAGHLCEEMIYLRLFGDVLGNAGEPKAAVEVLAAAGAGEKAAELAARLGELADTGYLLARLFGPPVAAAAQVTGAQAQLIPDCQVTETATALLDIAEKTWGPRPGWGADPARQALQAVSLLGIRIPASLADRLLAVITPALTAPSWHTEAAVSILVNLYLLLPGRRAELAPRITDLLGQSAVQPYIWGLLANLREGREYLLPDLELRAGADEEQATGLLAVWGTVGPDGHLAARRAAARLLRWQTGIPREFLSFEMWDRAAGLLVALLEASGPLAAVAATDLQDPQGGSGPGQPDEAAVLAAGDPAELAAACADKLTAIASDGGDSIISRHHAVAALRMLLPHLPADLCGRLAGDLARLHADPGLSEQDMWDLQSLRPLSSGQTDTGARTFSAAVLLAAAEACAQAGAHGEADESLAAEIADAAVDLVRNEDADVAAPGAQALAVAAPFARDAAVSPFLLAAHPEERVRRQAVALWLSVGGPPGIIGRLARDESPDVRAVVAHEAERATAAAPGEAGKIRALADDPHYAVRRAYACRRGQA